MRIVQLVTSVDACPTETIASHWLTARQDVSAGVVLVMRYVASDNFVRTGATKRVHSG